LGLIGRGLFRKLVIADGVAGFVNTVYADPGVYGRLAIATAVVAFSLQIYGDFAGYTDIARGVAKLFGVDLMVNFRFPYSARGFSEFWRRWHISLSSWLRDYLYIPLGGNQRGSRRTYINLMATMLLGGLWHGAGWGFLIWGGLHGLYLAMERLVQRVRQSDTPFIPAPLVFLVVTLTWIPFRAQSVSEGWAIFSGLFGPFDGRQLVTAPIVVGILGAVSWAIDGADREAVAKPVRPVPAFARGAYYGFGIVAALVLAGRNTLPFIYFQF
jgi:alginate O-acetyltransferase complex protein AlgI